MNEWNRKRRIPYMNTNFGDSKISLPGLHAMPVKSQKASFSTNSVDKNEQMTPTKRPTLIVRNALPTSIRMSR